MALAEVHEGEFGVLIGSRTLGTISACRRVEVSAEGLKHSPLRIVPSPTGLPGRPGGIEGKGPE